MPQALEHTAIIHGGIRPVLDPDLGVEINGQTAIRYLRFRAPVRIGHIELPLLQGNQVGRWVPQVPGHPAHLVISVLDRPTGRWRVVKDVDLPPVPGVDGTGLSNHGDTADMEAHFHRITKETPPHRIELGGIETDHLRIECDREHPVFANHGECNGPPFHVPHGILNGVTAHGNFTGTEKAQAVRGELLAVTRHNPVAPEGMTVRDLPHMLLFEGPQLAIGFSLRRPLLMHLGWDAWGEGRAAHNRLSVTRPYQIFPAGGLSGPLVRGLDVDTASHLWTGTVEVEGNRVVYRVHPQAIDLRIEAAFTVEAARVRLDLTMNCGEDLPLIEAEAWRFAWDLRGGMTSTAGLAAADEGRNGRVAFPAFFTADGDGCLACRWMGGTARDAFIQSESYRAADMRTDGFVLAPPPDAASAVLPAGVKTAAIELAVTSFQPAAGPVPAPPGLRRYWGSVFSCYRPELGGFSNHAASVNVHTNQWAAVEIAARTARPENGPEPLALARFTIERALMNGGGYSFHRSLYADSDPVLVSMAGRLHQAQADAAWLERIRPGLDAAFERMAASVGEEGLLVNSELSGNTGSFRWSSNAMDVIGFGHIDAYVNAWAYRAFRNAAALFSDLSDEAASARAMALADGLRAAYARELLNPETGWIAGWKSRDGRLHDYAFLWINGPALAFGLLDDGAAATALHRLEDLRARVGLGSARAGFPCNLLPIAEGDHMLGRIQAGGASQPTFENYTDGGMNGNAGHYLLALSRYGLHREADRLAAELDEGFAAGLFTGGAGGGQEFLSWEGLRTGYEGTLTIVFHTLCAIAIHRTSPGVCPAWWPAPASENKNTSAP